MVYEKNYLLVNEVVSFNTTKQVLALVSVIKNGEQLCFYFKLFKAISSFKVEVISSNKVVFSSFKTECNLSYSPEILNNLSLVIYSGNEVIGFYSNSGLSLPQAKQILDLTDVSSDLEIEKLIDSTMFNSDYLFGNLPFYGDERRVLTKPLTKVKTLSYYQKYEALINRVFDNCPKDELLGHMFKNSRWARFRKNGKNYVIGLIYRNSRPQFLGVGLVSLNAPSFYLNDKLLGRLRFYRVNKNQKFGYFLSFRATSTGKRVN